MFFTPYDKPIFEYLWKEPYKQAEHEKIEIKQITREKRYTKSIVIIVYEGSASIYDYD